MLAVNRTAHRIANQTGFKGGRFQARVELVAGIKDRFRVAVCDEFHADEKAASTDVPHQRVLTERIVQHIRQLLPLAGHLIHKTTR